ncbi:MLO-like protein [Quillaja saponaria]|uniref:MLO-like protein n=1 Tax=Quillaja saponaria TaxID=32244 RepID=A0AAD7L539_QUISA|nr:MLO-like protein [Quillaja saponaria]
MAAGGGGATTIEDTPTWVVAVVFSVMFFIALFLKGILRRIGKYFNRRRQRPLFEALKKIEEGRILRICISKHLSGSWLPCKRENASSSTSHFHTFFNSIHISGTARGLLAQDSASTDYCAQKGKVSLLSTAALHHIRLLIFSFAAVHLVSCVLTFLCSITKARQWKHWEDSILSNKYNVEQVVKMKVQKSQEQGFISVRLLGIDKSSASISWLESFFKQFYGSITKSDYIKLRHGFLKAHSVRENFDFQKYNIRAIQTEFCEVVQTRWYYWLLLVILLPLNVSGRHGYFWISSVSLILLLTVGAKLEHVIYQLAPELEPQPSDSHFWFNRPRILLSVIHFVLFLSSFQLAFIFWIWVQYGFHSCIMGQVGYMISSVIIGAFVQFFCGYNTLPLYSILTNMGSQFRKPLFGDNISDALSRWASRAKQKVDS